MHIPSIMLLHWNCLSLSTVWESRYSNRIEGVHFQTSYLSASGTIPHWCRVSGSKCPSQLFSVLAHGQHNYSTVVLPWHVTVLLEPCMWFLWHGCTTKYFCFLCTFSMEFLLYSRHLQTSKLFLLQRCAYNTSVISILTDFMMWHISCDDIISL